MTEFLGSKGGGVTKVKEEMEGELLEDIKACAKSLMKRGQCVRPVWLLCELGKEACKRLGRKGIELALGKWSLVMVAT